MRRGAIIVLALAATLGTAGCSALRLGYGQGPQLAHWWLDGYLDFDAEQSARVRPALAQWFAWHRETQLGDYAALLARAGEEAQGALNGAQVCRWSDQLRSRIEPALERALPLAAELAATLTPRQLTHLEKRYAKANQKLRKELVQSDLRERLEGSVERTVERFESFYGPLDEGQRRIVAEAMAGSPFDAAAWMRDREQRQRELVATLRRIAEQRPDPVLAQDLLRRVARRFDGSPQPTTRDAQEQLARHNCDLVARVHNAASAEQRRHLHDKLRAWELDFRQLAAEATQGPAQATLTPALRR